MPKKKKRNDDNKKPKAYQYELDGLLLILIAVIGFGRYAIIGDLIGNFAVFLVGVYAEILLFFVMILGIYMIVKREKPNLYKTRLLGLYIIAFTLIMLAHTKFVPNGDFKIFDVIKETVDIFLEAVSKGEYPETGGGIIGAIFYSIFVKLISTTGTKIAAFVMITSGIIIFTESSIIDLYKKFANKIKLPKLMKKHQEEIIKVADDYEKDNKIVVSSMEELVHMNADKTNELKEEKIEQLELNLDDNKTSGYNYPPINLLNSPIKNSSKANHDVIKENSATLEKVFKDFEIDGKIVATNVGPSVTQYEMELKAGTKVSKVLSIHREIALSLAAKDVRIQAPIPGKKTIGIELPNKVNTTVTVREILETIPASLNDSKLLVTLGRNIMGRPVYAEINKTPHLLVAGATGSGKSVCINSIIISILMRARPDEVKLVLVDPKKVELSMYNGAPHLLAPVVTDPRKANVALKKIVAEMERRYDIFSETNTKNIAGYNMYIEKKNKILDEAGQLKKLPYIVVIIDELADLMLVAAKEVEDSIMRITQMARAAGIHLIVATQRPSTDVITGLIKANIPSRISFAVSSSIDSRTILDMTGAEKLLGRGDMLFLPMGENMPIRVQGTFISDEEIKDVVNYTIAQQKAHYDETLLLEEEDMKASSMVDDDDYEEPLYNEIVEFVVTQGKASASLLQRRFRLGYNRAARVIDLLEERGIIGPNNGSKPREVLVKLEEKN